MSNDCCPVCVEDLNKSVRKPVKCNRCEYTVCMQCFEHYQMDHSGMYNVHCMSCKQLWDDQDVRQNISSAVIQRLTAATKKRLRDEETAFMPETQMYVEYGNAVESVKVSECMNLVKEMQELEYQFIDSDMRPDVFSANERLTLKRNIEKKKSEIFAIKHRILSWRRSHELSVGFKDIMPEPLYHKHFQRETNAPTESVPRQKTPAETIVVCPCPADDCRGFVTRKEHKCGVCSQAVCNQCLAPKISDHVCNESDIQSAKLILKSSKPCPKCATRIHKIDGCDQMWCTQCNSSFSWNTGQEIVGQVIHNPHYYEWLRNNNRNGGAAGLRAVGCEGLPNANHLDIHLGMVFKKDRAFRNTVWNVHRACAHHQNVDIRRRRPQQVPDEQFRANMDIRMKWLTNKTTDKAFETMLHKRYKQKLVNQRTVQVYELLVTLWSDVLHRILHIHEDTEPVREGLLAEFKEIERYANECFQKLEHLYKAKMPRVGMTV